MKAITLLQPWASLMVNRGSDGRPFKMFETRSWRTHYRGPVAIHSSAAYPRGIALICARPPFSSALPGPPDLPLGRVLGIGQLVDCLPVEEALGHPLMTLDEAAFGNYAPGRWAWLVKDMRKLEAPVPAKGSLGLWNWEPEGA